MTESEKRISTQILDNFASFKKRKLSARANRINRVGKRLGPRATKANYPNDILKYLESSQEHKVLTLKGALDIQTALNDFTVKEFEDLCGKYKKYYNDTDKEKLVTAFKELKKYYAAICLESLEMANAEGAEKYGKIVLAHRNNKIIGVYYLPA